MAALGPALLASSHVGAAPPETVAAERSVKAAYLYRFLSFVEWPAPRLPDAQAPLRIAVVGADDLERELQSMVQGRLVQRRNVSVRSLNPSARWTDCHLLFVSRSLAPRLNAQADALQDAGVLVVSEHEAALDYGAMINFVLQDQRLRFEVALDSAEAAGLKLDSRLLAAATKIRRASTSGGN